MKTKCTIKRVHIVCVFSEHTVHTAKPNDFGIRISSFETIKNVPRCRHTQRHQILFAPNDREEKNTLNKPNTIRNQFNDCGCCFESIKILRGCICFSISFSLPLPLFLSSVSFQMESEMHSISSCDVSLKFYRDSVNCVARMTRRPPCFTYHINGLSVNKFVSLL